MRLGVLLLALGAACGSLFPEMKLRSGTVRGVRDHGVARYLGIPFAAPPVGQLRWQPPAPVGAWEGVREAFKYGNTCYQADKGVDPWLVLSKASEDCLYCNLWVPDGGANMSAMVFFYGGSWQEGSASMGPLYNGQPSAGLAHSTVVLVCNYRLNVFGFLGGDALRASDNSTGNFGIQDQRFALQWLHENADALGVNLSTVMIYGESAGAGSVSHHLTQQASWPYFTRAAMESGPAAADWVAQDLTVANNRLAKLLKLTGCPSGPAARACLVGLNSSALFQAGRALPEGDNLVDWAPVIDGVSLTGHPRELVHRGQFHRVPVLLGTNKNEGSTFTSCSSKATPDEYQTWVETMFRRYNIQGLEAKVLAQYPASNYNATRLGSASFWASSAAVGDYAMTCPARRTARWISSAANAPPVYLYFFSRKFESMNLVEAVAKKPLGVFHGSELGLVFDIKLLLNKAEQRLALQTVELWTSFAERGKPTCRSAISWPEYNKTSDVLLALDIPIGVRTGLKNDSCNFWDKVGPLL